ncbi:hypothetical protein D9756_006141 [Leucocoprinus leucothites]|uniref:F-box domain-containing protein n=1 Tax=Leucocoprinus leucothites TaxID=201217 RepID=A0A8H5D4Z8_9AGAR|nr:hypothetical protein D9756_006141 [Leucoagaricus leucothites]
MSNSCCPHCHQRISPQNPLSSHPSDLQDEIEQVRSEIEGLNSLLDVLTQKRVVLLQRLNYLQSTVSVLPPETLALIFKSACTANTYNSRHSVGITSITPLPRAFDWEEDEKAGSVKPYHCTQLILSAVSSRWREVTHSTPQLWATLELDGSKERTVKQQFTILRHFLHYSRQLPFSLSVRFARQSFLLDETMGLIYKNKNRIQSLRLVQAPESWMQHVPLLPYIAEFHAKYCLWAELQVPGKCSHLTVDEHYGDVRLMTYHTLTVLRLRRVSVDVALNLLRQCPNLIEYRNREPEVYLHDEIELPTEPFSLAQLETFEWHAYATTNVIFDEAMCAFAHLPVLRELVWGEMAGGDYSYALPLFERLPSSLSSLTLVGCSVENSIATLDFVPDGLSIDCITLSRCKDALSVISRLKERPNSSTWRLPKLNSIFIHSTPSVVALDSALADLLEGRSSKGALGTFRIEISSDSRDQVHNHSVFRTPETRQRFREVVAGGIELEIVENGEIADWLWLDE